MKDLVEKFHNGFWGVMARHRVWVSSERRKDLIEWGDPSAILARVHHVHVEEEGPGFKGRKRKLCMQRNGDRLKLRARCRALPESVESASDALVRWATDGWNRRVPVCCADTRTGRIDILVELARAELVDLPEDQDPVTFLIDFLLADPLDFLSRARGETWVGSQVARRLRSLLAAEPRSRWGMLKHELQLLEQTGASAAHPRRIAQRIDVLRRVLGQSRPPADPTDADVERELVRLQRLIASDACGALYLGDSEITGLLNPRELEAGWCLKPLRFRLSLDGVRPRPVLHLWNANAPERRGRRPAECLGRGETMVVELMSFSDIYGLVDLVLNFVETNMVGAVQCNRLNPAPRDTANRTLF